MKEKLIQLNKSLRKKELLQLRSGDVVRIHKKIKEGDKERIQIFKGLVIAIKGKQSSSPTITVRRESQGIGVEIIFPLYSPLITKVELLRHSKVRRAKLYYMRDRTGKSAKMKVQDLKQEEVELMKDSDKSEDSNQEGSDKSIQKEEKPEEKTEAKKNDSNETETKSSGANKEESQENKTTDEVGKKENIKDDSKEDTKKQEEKKE